MIDVVIDVETYSPIPLKHGTYKYAEKVEPLLVAYQIDEGFPRVWDVADHEPMPYDLEMVLQESDSIFTAHNALFDRTVLRMGLGLDIPIPQWRCTMVQAYSHALPGKLETLCKVMKVPLDEAKLDTGRALIQLFCMPHPTWKGDPRATARTHPAEWALFKEYAASDIRALRAVRARMPAWNMTPTELALWFADQRMNDRGYAIDLPYVSRVVDVIKDAEAVISARASEITEGAVERVTQRDRLLTAILEQFGVDLPDLQSATIERRLEDPDLPGLVKELLELRLDGSKTSTAKYRTLIRSTSSDGRMRGTTQHNGAGRTGRSSGRLFQMQNLMRPPKAAKPYIKDFIRAVKAGIATQTFEKPIDMASAAMRGSVIAAPGKLLRVCDKSAIENRMGAWLAGEEWKLKAYREFDAGIGPDIYELSYANAFKVPIEVVRADTLAGGILRQVGKVNELSLMYQGAVGAWQSMAEVYGVTLPDEEALVNVKGYRASNSEIKAHWYELNDAALRAIFQPNKWFECRRLAFRRVGAWLQLRLPSGRLLCYPSIRADEDGKITYYGMNQYTHKWERTKIYGGKFFAHATQGSSRDELYYDLPHIEDAGLDILALIHDETVTEADAKRLDALPTLREIMSTPHDWCKDLPLAVSGFEDDRYRKD